MVCCVVGSGALWPVSVPAWLVVKMAMAKKRMEEKDEV